MLHVVHSAVYDTCGTEYSSVVNMRVTHGTALESSVFLSSRLSSFILVEVRTASSVRDRKKTHSKLV